MSRRISTKKRFPERDTKYDNLLVSLLVNRILKSGKKRLAKRIVYKAFEFIEFRTNQNPILFDGDILIIPKNPNAINVLGEVLNPVAFEYTDKLTVRSAIQQAGGYQQYADKRRVYIIKANGIIEKPGRSVFARNSNLKAGDTIVVPRKINTNGLQNLVPFTQIISDLAFSAAAIDNLSNN